MIEDGKIYMGLSDSDEPKRVYMHLSQANRHGLIAGASGTGKTITMKVMAESFSQAGVPVFMVDAKGDVSGINAEGADNEGMQKRIDKFGVRDSFTFRSYPTIFWDIYGEGGHPIRTTVSDMGPELLSRLMNLTEAQEGVMNVVFRVADNKGYKILDLKDLRAMLNYVAEHRIELAPQFGSIAAVSVNAIIRSLLPLEDKGGNFFFGEPALDIRDWMRVAPDGRGYINVLHAPRTMENPSIYSMFMLWLLAELFENLPEAGDADKPKLVFFFDEAHLLFSDAPKILIQKVEQTVKLIRSKGVGVYFVTQSPSDIPDTVLAQLSNRVQHGLRAYTPAEQKAVRTAAQTFRSNPAFKTEDLIMELGTGEALVSCLDEKGVPQIVEKTKIMCPESLMAPCSERERTIAIEQSPVLGKYDDPIDNYSAYEAMEQEKEISAKEAEIAAKEAELARKEAELQKQKEKEEAAKKKEEEKKKAQKEKAAERRKSKIESQLIQAGGQILKRGLLGILKF